MPKQKRIGYENGVPTWEIAFEENADGPLLTIKGMPGAGDTCVRLHGISCNQAVATAQTFVDSVFKLYCEARAYQRDLKGQGGSK